MYAGHAPTVQSARSAAGCNADLTDTAGPGGDVAAAQTRCPPHPGRCAGISRAAEAALGPAQARCPPGHPPVRCPDPSLSPAAPLRRRGAIPPGQPPLTVGDVHHGGGPRALPRHLPSAPLRLRGRAAHAQKLPGGGEGAVPQFRLAGLSRHGGGAGWRSPSRFTTSPLAVIVAARSALLGGVPPQRPRWVAGRPGAGGVQVGRLLPQSGRVCFAPEMCLF